LPPNWTPPASTPFFIAPVPAVAAPRCIKAVYVDGMRHLVDAFPGAFPLYTSSTSVYPQTDGEIVDETSFADPDRDTGRLLREAENIALNAKGAVARLAGIYGPGRSFVLKNLLEGKAAIEGNHGQGRILNQIHADDAAAALVHLVTQRLAASTTSWTTPR
jgi:nucleoside-diphosphate-sugar epimerase